MFSVEPGNFFELITDAQEQGSEHKIASIMCGAVKSLSQNRTKPEQSLTMSLLYLSKTNSSLFEDPVVIDVLSEIIDYIHKLLTVFSVFNRTLMYLIFYIFVGVL